MPAATTESLSDILAECHDDPDLFNEVVLGRPSYHRLQVEWGDAVVRCSRVAIETGNALGKDYFVGGLILWWLYTRPNSLVIVTGPSQTLLGSVTWKEVRNAVDGSEFFRSGLLSARITAGVKTSPQLIEVAPGWHALGFSTTTVERASGQHNKHLLVIVEEASGVEDHIWEALDGLVPTKLVAIGNPLRPDGGFVDMCEQGIRDERDGVPDERAVRYFNVPSTMSPDADKETSEYGLACLSWLEAMRRKYGEHSLWYKSHVLAIRPKLSHEILIQPEWLDRATSDMARSAAEKWRRERKGGKKRMSCDVGEGVGNARSVIVVRDDVGIIEIEASAFAGPHETAQRMADLANAHQIDAEHVTFDANGTTGKRLANALPGKGLHNVRGFLGGSSGGKRFANMRTSCAAAFARRLDPDGYAGGKREDRPFHIPICPEIQTILEELRELRGQIANNGRYALEHKQDFMERLGRSPDYADAICMGWREEAVTG